MSAAIQTKFIAPTDARPITKVKASAPKLDGKSRSVTCEWQYQLGVEGNHRYAAEKLANKLRWDGVFAEGHLDEGGYVYVRLGHGETLKSPAFMVVTS